MSAHTAAAQLAEDRVVRDCLVNHWREILLARSKSMKAGRLMTVSADRWRNIAIALNDEEIETKA